jgi:hypothetical protein
MRPYLGGGRQKSRIIEAESKYQAWWHLEQLIEESQTERGPSGSFSELLVK